MKQDVDVVMKSQEINNQDEYFMTLALKEAKIAYMKKDVPVGCVIVKDGKVISKARNQRYSKNNAIYHAEITAIKSACKHLKSWVLEDCTMYVTLEPCAMCAGAILQARMKEVVYATKEKKFGCCGSIVNLLNNPQFNHQVIVRDGILKKEATNLLKDFFKDLRNNK